MKYQKPISSAVRRRLPRYYRYLSTLLELGISKISSKDLGNRMGITSSQVRQDFSSFGGYGLQRYGYDVESLHQEIGNILGLNTIRNMIIIGAGSLGQALAKHKEFEKKGFKVIAIFDVKTELIGQKITEHEIRHLDSLPHFLENNQVDIAILTIPENFGREVAAYITELGIKAIWNFVPIELKTPDDVIVENIHLIDSLMVLGYNLKHKRRE
ncbi:MAG: redox-sensing transcriptional repressor Rex [Peptococcaceae bacterium]|nr:redox-sensing transcriptional repressor Rex [Peptococcaceae bacterium]